MKLQSAEEVWREFCALSEDVERRASLREIMIPLIEADREALGEVIIEALKGVVFGGGNKVAAAVRAIAKPPESTRERLGRALYKAWVAQVCDDMPPAEWHDLTDGSQEQEMEMAAAVQAELALIQEEADGSDRSD